MISIARIQVDGEEKNVHKFVGDVSTQSNSFYNDGFFYRLYRCPKMTRNIFIFSDSFKLFRSVRYCWFKAKNEFEI